MRRILTFVAIAALASPISAHQAAPSPSLFDHLVGTWVLRGTIDGKETVHDVIADFVLGGYVRLHEVSREKDAKGAPAYEAIVFISVDKKSGDYSCLWLDNTSNAGLSGDGIGHAKVNGSSIPFVLKFASGDVFHTTFIYNPANDTWQWVMDGESGGKLQPFARVTLTKALSAK